MKQRGPRETDEWRRAHPHAIDATHTRKNHNNNYTRESPRAAFAAWARCRPFSESSFAKVLAQL